MENTLENETVLDNETPEPVQEPIVIEKKARKKRETQSPAQLETLRRGRERLAEKRKKQREEQENLLGKKVTELIEKCTKTLEKTIEKFEEKSTECPELPTITPPLRPKLFV